MSRVLYTETTSWPRGEAMAEAYLEKMRVAALGAARRYGIVFLCAYLANLVVYAYLVTTFIFTNHTTQNSLLLPYPSHRTDWEGRWLHDLILQASGGLGVQSMQMFVAVAIQIVNGILLARLLGLQGRFYTLLVALFISLHPNVMDYYSFNSDAVSFTLGDMLMMVAATILARNQDWLRSSLLSALCMFLAFSIYQPKVSVLAVLMIIAFRQVLLRSAADGEGGVGRVLVTVVRFALPVAIAAVCYFVVLAFILTQYEVLTAINPAGTILRQMVLSYGHALGALVALQEMLWPPVFWVAVLCLAAGFASVFVDAWTKPSAASIAVCLAMLLLPSAVYMSFVLNESTWSYAGRIFVPEAYATIFLLSLIWRRTVLGYLSIAVTVSLLYVFAIIGSQESQAAQIRSTIEVGRMGRLFSRIEAAAPDLYQTKHGLLVIGVLPDDIYRHLVRLSWRTNRPNTAFSPFARYHHTDYMNLLAGAEIFRRVPGDEYPALIAESKSHPVWPAPGSVFETGETIVVVLQPYRDGIEMSDPL